MGNYNNSRYIDRVRLPDDTDYEYLFYDNEMHRLFTSEAFTRYGRTSLQAGQAGITLADKRIIEGSCSVKVSSSGEPFSDWPVADGATTDQQAGVIYNTTISLGGTPVQNQMLVTALGHRFYRKVEKSGDTYTAGEWTDAGSGGSSNSDFNHYALTGKTTNLFEPSSSFTELSNFDIVTNYSTIQLITRSSDNTNMFTDWPLDTDIQTGTLYNVKVYEATAPDGNDVIIYKQVLTVGNYEDSPETYTRYIYYYKGTDNTDLFTGDWFTSVYTPLPVFPNDTKSTSYSSASPDYRLCTFVSNGTTYTFQPTIAEMQVFPTDRSVTLTITTRALQAQTSSTNILCGQYPITSLNFMWPLNDILELISSSYTLGSSYYKPAVYKLNLISGTLTLKGAGTSGDGQLSMNFCDLTEAEDHSTVTFKAYAGTPITGSISKDSRLIVTLNLYVSAR